jgi:carotenoid cleavage dioxygenase-like enzyme
VLALLRRWQRVPGHPLLSGIYTPVKVELLDKELEVEGEVPAELDGIYIRTGPNPQFFSPQGGYHL